MKQTAFHPGFWPSLLTLIAIVILICLGSWQVQRLQWKAEVLTLLDMRMNQPPEALPADIADPMEWDYRRVSIEGRFLHDHEFYLMPRQFEQLVGFQLLTPFDRGDGGIIVVNRGFVPEVGGGDDRPLGEVTLSGVAHIPDDRNVFTPENQTGDDQIYWSDLDFISAETGLEIDKPLVLYAGADPLQEAGYPIGGQIRLDIPNNHLQYAVFWYMMALVLAVIFMLYGFRPKEPKT